MCSGCCGCDGDCLRPGVACRWRADVRRSPAARPSCDDEPDGSVVDASVVLAQSGGMVLIGDQADIEVLARDALTVGVQVELGGATG